MDEVTDPSLSVLAEDNSLSYKNFLNGDGDFVQFDYYLVTESDLDEGDLNRLELYKDILDNIRGILENIRYN